MVKTKKQENEKLVTILSYFLIGIIWYFVDEKIKSSKLVKFHVKQSLNLLLISFVGNFILSIIIFLGWLLIPLWTLFMLILWVIGLIHAINEKEKEIPIIGQFAKKYLTF
ncbi:MAG: DUF4870 domain-containing protein [Nanoarchaeota archaeon]